MPVTKTTLTQCLWPGCNARPTNMKSHMIAIHNVTVNQSQQVQPRASATAPRQLSSVQATANITADTLLKKSVGHAVRCTDCDIAARIIEQATDRDGNVRRRRECPQCFTRFTTYEVRFAEVENAAS